MSDEFKFKFYSWAVFVCADWEDLQQKTILISAHKSWLFAVCLGFFLICWAIISGNVLCTCIYYGYSWKHFRMYWRKKEGKKGTKEGRKKEKLPSRGRLRVANHPIIWIKQVAPHWESSLKWRSILALGRLWKWKHVSCLACSDFSNEVRLGIGEAFPDAQ